MSSMLIWLFFLLFSNQNVCNVPELETFAIEKRTAHPVLWIGIVLMPIRIRISILMPIRIRFRIDITTMRIHMRILPQYVGKQGKKIHSFTAMPVYSVFLSNKWKRCHVVKYILDRTLKISGKKAHTKKHVLGTTSNPDLPDPPKWCGYDYFFQLVLKLEGRVVKILLTFLLSVILVTYFMSACL